VRILLTLLVTLLLAACENTAKPLSEPEQGGQDKGNRELIVVTHNGPNTYYVNGDNEIAGLEYDLAQLFAKELGAEYSVRFLLADNITKVIPALLKGQAHLAAADLSITPIRKHVVRFSMPYQSVQQQVVYNTDQKNDPEKVQDLIGKRIAVPAGTSYAERLREIAKNEPSLKWQEPTNASTDALLEQVSEGLLDYTIADDHLVALVQNYYPNLGIGLALGKPEQIAWAFPRTGNAWLYDRANQFFARIKKDGTLRNLLDRYYGHSTRLDTMDVSTFLQRIHTLLPQYVGLFKEAQKLTGIDWRLLAAVGYRESHWDRLNTSPTNVRGLMMLTEKTADLLGVTDRLDAKQSIMGGARYLQLLKYYTNAKYGYANGGAPVIFVESVRTYHKILEKYEPQPDSALPDFGFTNWILAPA